MNVQIKIPFLTVPSIMAQEPRSCDHATLILRLTNAPQVSCPISLLTQTSVMSLPSHITQHQSIPRPKRCLRSHRPQNIPAHDHCSTQPATLPLRPPRHDPTARTPIPAPTLLPKTLKNPQALHQAHAPSPTISILQP